MSNIAIAKECIQNKQNQIYWRFYAHNMILEANDKNEWIKEEKYRDSIINVIGKAIGDCMAMENEFKCTDRQVLGNKTIIFENTEHLKYTQSNWNAVILYNAVNLAINNKQYRQYNNINSESIIQEAYKKIKEHYKIVDDTKKITEKLKRLETQAEEIMGFLEKKHQAYNKLLEEDKTNEYAKFHKDNVEQLQKALKDFNEGIENIESLYKCAMDKLVAAHTPIEVHQGILQFQSKILDDETSSKIESFLSQRLLNIEKLEMPKKLEKARNDMLKYSKALQMDKILIEDYSADLSGDRYTPFSDSTVKFKLHPGGKSYNNFTVGNLMKCEAARNTGEKFGKFPIFQCVGYFPFFFIAKDRSSDETNIYISRVDKIELSDSENLLYQRKHRLIESYKYGREDQYAEVLKLLQGLVEPLNGKENRFS